MARTGLNAEQRDAVVMMLTAATATTVLIAPAGAGKSHTMAEFARLWTSFTGRRVIGLTTSTNAARVLEHEGLAESYNIAEFLGKTEGSDELRRPVPLHRDDVLVLDEASQLSTADLAMISEAARQAGARIIATGDTAAARRGRRRGNVPACWPARSPPRSCTRSAGSRRSGSGRPASGSVTATRPRPPPTTGTAGSGAPTRKPPTTAPRRCGSPTTCAARTCCCSPGPTPKPPNCPGACRPGSSSSARSGTPQAALSDGNQRRRRRPGPRPPQHRDRRRRPQTHQPRHAEDHRPARAGRGGAAAAAGRDLDRAVPGPQVLPRAQRRTRLRRQRPRRPGPHRRHRAPPRHRTRCPGRPCTSA